MLKQIAVILFVLASIPLVLRLLAKLGLLPLVLYAALMNTVFAEWAEIYPIVSTSIFVAMALLVIFSWIHPLLQRMSESRAAEKLLLNGIRQAHARGLSSDQYHIS